MFVRKVSVKAANLKTMPFPFYRQFDAMDCGAACLKMVAEFHGRRYSLQHLRQYSYLDREGVSSMGIAKAAEALGLQALPVKVPFEGKEDEAGLTDAPLPLVAHWGQRHFVVVHKISRKHVWVADPASGKIKLALPDFKRHWSGKGERGVVILFETTPRFWETDEQPDSPASFGHLLKYLKPYRRLIVQLVIGLVAASAIQLAFPFLTQAIVDTGIANHDLRFVWLILFAQLMLFAGQVSVRFLQSWILLHIGSRVNISMVGDFLVRLMAQPLQFFDTKMTGDLLQRIADHRRIEEFLTGSTLNILFSLFNLFVFGLVLAVYNLQIFTVFVFSSLAYLGWILVFMKKRANADYLRFRALSENQSQMIELIQGMPEIKLQNSERKRRYAWANVQARMFRANVRSLSVSQWQEVGAQTISQLKDIVIAAIAAALVVEGQITLGMMLAISFILGQLNVPLQQFIVFARSAQDAKISLDRLAEIHGETPKPEYAAGMHPIQPSGGFEIENLHFHYNPLSGEVLKNISLTIPEGKVTAIVGSSGSGKTTLVKLLLGFYEPVQGSIKVGQTNLKNIPSAIWRSNCGAVLQDGFVFSDTIASNIAESDGEWTKIDKPKLLQAVQVAAIQDFVEHLPLGYNTMVGAKGNGLSQGQKQRLLIARAVYKSPQYLFFDEATNALDAHTEKLISENLSRFYAGRTVVIVAHRLSTVKNADQIVVLERGQVVELGDHQSLTAKRGAYYQLVREQLELGA